MGLCRMSYKGFSFWIPDIDMQLMFYYIYKEMIKTQYHFTQKTKLLRMTDFLVRGYAFGDLWLGWEKYFTTEEDSRTMVLLLENVRLNMQDKGNEISAEEIETIPIDDSHFKRCIDRPFPVPELVRITVALIQMVNGTWDVARNNKNLL